MADYYANQACDGSQDSCYENVIKSERDRRENSGKVVASRYGTLRKRKWTILAFVILSIAVGVLTGLVIVEYVALHQNRRDPYPDIAVLWNRTDQKLKAISKTMTQQVETFRSELQLSNSNLTNLINKTMDLIINDGNSIKWSVRKIALVQAAGWYAASNNLIYKLITKEMNYTDAEKRCESYGGTLITKGLRDPTVYSELFEADMFAVKPWIGYNDIETEGQWQWIDSGQTNEYVVKWKENQPDDHRSSEDCGHIYVAYSSNVELNDDSCSDKHSSVCEKV